MPKNKKYTAADFESYHSGKMNAGDMHALEKAALADPFLGDALEGYAFTNTPVKDIEDLKENLQTKKTNKKIVYLYPKKIGWLKIAALFVLIAGIGFLAYELNFKKENNSLAMREDSTEIKKIDEQVDAPTLDPFSNAEKDLVSDSSSQQNKKTVESKSLGKSIQRAEKNIVAGKIVDVKGSPLSAVTIMNKSRKSVTTSDVDGKFKLTLKDTSLTATIAMVGFKTKESRLSDKSEQIIVMEPDNKTLNEVVVTASGAPRQEKALGSPPKIESKAGVPVSLNSEPVIGWQEFHQYLQDNINIPEDEKGMGFKGKVVLSFEINKRGNPQKIKIEQTLCPACDREAVRLINQGPKWKYIQDKRQQVTIQF